MAKLNRYVTSLTLLGALLVLSAALPGALLPAQRLKRHIQTVTIASRALEGNLIGDPSVREMVVLIPPSYYRQPRRRFPVVFLLHGLGKRSNGQTETSSVFPHMFNEMLQKRLSEMILIAVDGATVLGGSYYANSPTIGNFEDYVVKEIVPLVDSLFRTFGARKGRAIAGFSMGGYGAIKLAMKYSESFSQVGSLSGSPLSIRYRKSIYKRALRNQKPPPSLKQLVEGVTFEGNWSLAAAYAKASAFSPNPSKPPLYLDLPFRSSNPDEDDPVWQRWLDDDPLSLLSKYQKNLRTLDQIYLDQGDDETALGTEDFDRELTRYNIGHNHYIYRGDHVDKMKDRYLRMLRFFTATWDYQ